MNVSTFSLSKLSRDCCHCHAPISSKSVSIFLGNSGADDWYFSSVYIESGPITGGDNSDGPSTSAPTTSISTTLTTGPIQNQYSQCMKPSGNPMGCSKQHSSGPTVCASSFTCSAVSPLSTRFSVSVNICRTEVQVTFKMPVKTSKHIHWHNMLDIDIS